MDAAYALSEVDVAGHYCDAFGMNGTQISVLKHLYYVAVSYTHLTLPTSDLV